MEAPVVIEVRDVSKTFRIPEHRYTSLKERAVHPFSATEFRELRALNDVSFDVARGEFFGIVGRNGSGKSTLLKILASIYRSDAGRIRMAGRLAPFIELGVGFDLELSARENVVLNGVMMGLTQNEAARSLDAVLDFAELRDFDELKLKNYSSGMMVRLAFSLMIQAEADILLIDEVLAVGDAAFQQKCADYFRQMSRANKTVVFVTHDMFAAESYCDRAMLLHHGDLLQIGDPEEVGRHYLRLNFEGGEELRAELAASASMAITGVRLEAADGSPTTNAEQGEPLRLRMEIKTREAIDNPLLSFLITNADGVHISGFGMPVEGLSDGRLEAGQTVIAEATVDNLLAPGRYYLNGRICRNGNPGDVALQAFNVFDFVIYGAHRSSGIVDLPAKASARAAKP